MGNADREYALAEEAQVYIRRAKSDIVKASLFAPKEVDEKLREAARLLLLAETTLHEWLASR